MLFNSKLFVIFFPIVFFFYYLTPAKFRNFLLLVASCIFYMAFVPKYILILFFLITVDYFLAKELDKYEGSVRKWLLVASVVANLGTLVVFKYFNFLSENIATLASFLHWNYNPVLLQILLPIGLSFHVFQSLSYVIEVYRKEYKPEHNYLTYALYVMFFPQLVAGPIERPQHLLPQLNITHEFNALNVRRGLERMLWGFFKKLVIADNLAQIVNPVYLNLPQDNVLLVLVAVMFMYQLYCDFSGYSDIALGTAMMLGFNLTENFNRPFSARSLTDFWRRWHISLSSWLRDYLYYPLSLGWGKFSRVKSYISLFITFVLIGLWHGASWAFVIFGAIHGVYLIIEGVTEKIRKKIATFFYLDKVKILHHFLQTMFVFLLVAISFVFFRSTSFLQAIWFVKNMLFVNNLHFDIHYILNVITQNVGAVVFIATGFSILLMEVVQYYQAKKDTFYIFDSKSRVSRYAWYYFLCHLIFFFGYFGAQTFIYFQF